MTLGTEWLIDAKGCEADALRDLGVLRRLFSRVIAEVGLKPLHEPAFHVFGGEGGITGFVMLSESHLAIHTFPEHCAATINLYCCRPRPEWPWCERLGEMIGATDVRVRVVEREVASSDREVASSNREVALGDREVALGDQEVASNDRDLAPAGILT